jgi:hypothetical protein
MERIGIVVILFVLVEGCYKRWLDGQEQDREQQIIRELAIAPIVQQTL